MARYARRPAASALLTCCVSLEGARLRPAAAEEALVLDGPLEIISPTGTLSASGEHLHVWVGDSEGAVCGGHLLPGCVIRTTAEIVLLAPPGLRFARQREVATGFREWVCDRVRHWP